jgi:drug/metabolite transporter (DMT)-like permease
MRVGRNLGLFVALSALWGLSFPAISAGLETLPPLLFAAFRYDVGGVLLLAFLVVRGVEWRPETREDGIAILIASGFFVLKARVIARELGIRCEDVGTPAVRYILGRPVGFEAVYLR